MSVRPPSAPALAGFALFLAGGALLGEQYPFSRYAMYAEAPKGGPSAVPIFRAGGADADPSSFDRFTGLDRLAPPPAPCGMGYRLDEIRHVVEARRDATGEPGPVRVEIGYVVLGDDGVEQAFVAAGEGRAWPR